MIGVHVGSIVGTAAHAGLNTEGTRSAFAVQSAVNSQQVERTSRHCSQGIRSWCCLMEITTACWLLWRQVPLVGRSVLTLMHAETPVVGTHCLSSAAVTQPAV